METDLPFVAVIKISVAVRSGNQVTIPYSVVVPARERKLEVVVMFILFIFSLEIEICYSLQID